MAWKRPENVPFPSVWRTFEGRKDYNGSKRQYWIQDITEEYLEGVVHYMSTGFVTEEPLTKYCNVGSDADAVRDIRTLWRDSLPQKLGLVCLTKGENGATKIAGMNCTCLSFKNEEVFFHPKNALVKKVLGIVDYMTKQVDAFEKFGISMYLTAFGLYVPPEFQGEGIGFHLLKAREPMCKALGIKASLTVFTSIVSQILAKRAGFEELYSISYEDLGREKEEFKTPGIEEHTKIIKYMYILYP